MAIRISLLAGKAQYLAIERFCRGQIVNIQAGFHDGVKVHAGTVRGERKRIKAFVNERQHDIEFPCPTMVDNLFASAGETLSRLFMLQR